MEFLILRRLRVDATQCSSLKGSPYVLQSIIFSTASVIFRQVSAIGFQSAPSLRILLSEITSSFSELAFPIARVGYEMPVNSTMWVFPPLPYTSAALPKRIRLLFSSDNLFISETSSSNEATFIIIHGIMLLI